MPRVDFVITNDRHHVAMVTPVLEALAGGDVESRLLSLCELRGMVTPASLGRRAACDIVRVLPARRPGGAGSGAASGAGGPATGRRILRRAAWRFWLRPRLARLLAAVPPRLLVLPNDAAYPYDRIVALGRRSGIPYLLLQEGIRFPLPAERSGPVYGRGGARAIAAWGRSSRDHFVRLGVPAETIHVTGTPRLGAPSRPRSRPPAGSGRGRLLLVSNPIDDQGFCSTGEKLALLRRFVDAVGSALRSGDLKLTLKLHAREGEAPVCHALGELAPAVDILGRADLASLFDTHDAVVVLASTVGLEALLAGLPLGVLEIPGHGFAHDYVARGGGIGLGWDGPPMLEQVRTLLSGAGHDPVRARRYLDAALAPVPDPAAGIARLIETLSHETP